MKIKLAEGFAFPADVVTQTFTIFGKRGSGKSTTAAVLAEEFFAAGLPFVVLDPVDTWWGLKASSDGKGPGLGVYVFGGRHADLPLEPRSGALVADLLVEHRMSAVLSLRHFSGGERGGFVTDFAKRLFQINREPLHVFLEEAHELAPENPRAAERGAEMVGAVSRLWKLGRSSGLGGSAITQRPASLSKNVTTQAEVLIVHRTIGPQDVEAIRGWIKYHGERDDILPQLSTLGPGEAFVWAPDFPPSKPIGLVRVKIRERRTFDSGATPKAGAARRAEPVALASVDLEKLRERMAETIERAEADDPVRLRARIKALEREVATSRSREADAEKIERAAEVASWDLENRTSELQAWAEVVSREFESAAEALRSALDEGLRSFAEEHAKALRYGFGSKLDEVAAAPAVRSLPSNEVAKRELAPRPQATRSPSLVDAEVGGGGAARMLAVLASYYPKGVPESQLAGLAGLKPRGGTWRTYKSRLRSQGLLRSEGRTLYATEAGVEAAGVVPELPRTVEAVLALWATKPGMGPVMPLVSAVVGSVDGLWKPDLAESCGLASSGGTFRTYLSRARTAGLLVTDGDLVRRGPAFEGLR